MTALWYAETVDLSGRWCPQTTPERPETVSKGGHLREQRTSGVGRRIRAIQRVEPNDIGKPLSYLQQIYGAATTAAVETTATAETLPTETLPAVASALSGGAQ